MTFTKIAVAGGVVLLGFLCFLAARGMAAVTEGLVTIFALALLVAGGNLLSGRGTYGTRRAMSPSMPTGGQAADAPSMPTGGQAADAPSMPTGGRAAEGSVPPVERDAALTEGAEMADPGETGQEGVTDPPEPGET